MKFRIMNKNPFFDYREACKVTQGIELTQEENEEIFESISNTTEWWIKQIIANHSTLRCIRFRLVDTRPKSVVMQVIRATKGHPQPEVQSSRPDWTGKERSLDPYEDKLFCQDHTAESFVEMAKQRLCARTEIKTRFFMVDAVKALKQSNEPFLRAVGYCCQPACYWLGEKCPEINGCGYCENKLSKKFINEYRKKKECR